MQFPSIVQLRRNGVVLAVLCGAALAQAKPAAMPATGAISGRVTLGGKPAQGVTVLALLEGGEMRQASAQAGTDAEGQYRLTGLPAGSFRVSAAARAYVSASEDERGYVPGRRVTLGAGEQLEGQDLALERGGVITGRVNDAAGRPLIEEPLKLFRLNAGAVKTPYDRWYGQPPRTDDRGVYRIYGLPAGRYLVAVGVDEDDRGQRRNTGGRRAFKLTYHHDPAATADAPPAKVLEVGYGSETDEVDIKLGASSRGHTVTVRVVEAETGQPLPGLHVGYGVIRLRSIDTAVSDDATTDSRGEKRFEGVLPGRYAAFIHNWNAGKDSEYYADPQPFEVREEAPTQLEIVARRGLQLSGNVTFEGVTDPALLAQARRLWLSLTQQGNVTLRSPYGNAVTLAPDFSFRFKGVAPGKYILSVSNSRDLRGFALARIEHNGAVWGEPFEVKEPFSGLRVVVKYGNARVVGQIQVTGGVLPANARLFVAAFPSGGSISSGASATPDPQGRFTLEYLTAGTYELRVSAFVPTTQIAPNVSPPSFINQQIASAKQSITLGNTGETPVTVTLDLSAQGRRQ